MAKVSEEEYHFRVVQCNKPLPSKCRRKSRRGSSSVGAEATKQQPFPFSSSKVSHRYRVLPAAQWSGLQSYRCFLFRGTRFRLGDFVRVANRLASQDSPTEHAVMDPKRPERDWIAYILEIRAADPYHVFARVYWMYWPEDIPKRVVRDLTRSHGPEIFHRSHEVIASNHICRMAMPWAAFFSSLVRMIVSDKNDSSEAKMNGKQEPKISYCDDGHHIILLRDRVDETILRSHAFMSTGAEYRPRASAFYP
ncbi:hypothetical protein BHE90_017416 [Fusarium euwallaceae]|uniref:BAH domain-containing protein n=1 Tax=Fusarium euwallaceae TaxID=1147111 RepID=A0A430KXL4_9HYPO|nr:hypothetical protein BHE90_017416 [Fusarium euwallaceae]